MVKNFSIFVLLIQLLKACRNVKKISNNELRKKTQTIKNDSHFLGDIFLANYGPMAVPPQSN